MKFNQCFFVFIFFSAIVNHQTMLHSADSVPRENKIDRSFKSKICFLTGHQDKTIDLKKCNKVMALYMQLYKRYQSLLPGLDDIIYSTVFNSFVDQKKEDEIYKALSEDVGCVQSAFGKTLQDMILPINFLGEPVDKSVSTKFGNSLEQDANKMYEHYVNIIGEFDKQLFYELFNYYVRSNQIDIIDDSFRQDTVKVQSVFGESLKQLILIVANKQVLQELEQAYNRHPNIVPVYQQILKNINTQNMMIAPLFFPKLIFLSFEKYFPVLNGNMLNLEEKVSLITNYYEQSTKIFLEFIPKEVEDCLVGQKYMDSFINIVREYQKHNDILQGNPRAIANSFKKSQNENQQLQLKAVRAKQIGSKDKSSSVVVQENLSPADLGKELERCIQLEMNRRIPIVKAQASDFETIEADQITSFKQAQQKEQEAVIDQESIALMQIKNQERDDFFNTFLTFLEGCRTVAATRLHEIKNKRFLHVVAGLHKQHQDMLIDESANVLAELKKQDLMIEPLSLEMKKEATQRALIDQSEQLTFQEFDSLKYSSIPKVHSQEKVKFIQHMTTVLTEHSENEQKNARFLFVDFAQGWRTILAHRISMIRLLFLDEKKREMLNAESVNSFERLKNQESQEKLSRYQVQPWTHNPYGCCVIPVEEVREDLLYALTTIRTEKESSRLESDSNGRWYVTGNYRWRFLPDGCYECEHVTLKMVGRIDSSGLAAVKAADNRWVSLNW